MPTPLGPKDPVEFTPELQIVVYDPTITDNADLEKIDPTAAQSGQIFADAITAADAWPAAEAPEDMATETYVQEYVDAQMAAITAALDAIMNP
jgi:hypothetical protein